MELHTIYRAALVPESCITTAPAPANGDVARGKFGDLVTVAHPDLGLLTRSEALEQAVRLLDFEHRPAVFALLRRRDAAPFELHDEVHPVTHTQHRRAVQ